MRAIIEDVVGGRDGKGMPQWPPARGRVVTTFVVRMLTKEVAVVGAGIQKSDVESEEAVCLRST